MVTRGRACTGAHTDTFTQGHTDNRSSNTSGCTPHWEGGRVDIDHTTHRVMQEVEGGTGRGFEGTVVQGASILRWELRDSFQSHAMACTPRHTCSRGWGPHAYVCLIWQVGEVASSRLGRRAAIVFRPRSALFMTRSNDRGVDARWTVDGKLHGATATRETRRCRATCTVQLPP